MLQNGGKMMPWEKTAVNNLKEIKEILDKLGIRYWLDWGSLLGAVRDRKLIEWAPDIDLGTMDDCWAKIVSAGSEFVKKGFDVYLEECKINGDTYERNAHFYRHGHSADLWLYQAKGKNAVKVLAESTTLISKGLKILYYLATSQKPHIMSKWKFVAKIIQGCFSLIPSKLRRCFSTVVWRAWKREDIKLIQITVPKHHFEKLGTLEFYGMTFNIPSDVESYLAYKYGKDWRTPRREWEWQKEDGAVKELTMG